MFEKRSLDHIILLCACVNYVSCLMELVARLPFSRNKKKLSGAYNFTSAAIIHHAMDTTVKLKSDGSI